MNRDVTGPVCLCSHQVCRLCLFYYTSLLCWCVTRKGGVESLKEEEENNNGLEGECSHSCGNHDYEDTGEGDHKGDDEVRYVVGGL